jgi:hypothetical protein
MELYLAGSFLPLEVAGKKYADWRDYVAEKVPKHRFLDPRKNDQSCPAAFTLQDMENVLKSDGVFHYRSLRGEAIGSAWEHGIANGASRTGNRVIPVIYVDECPFQFPLLVASAKRTFRNLDSGIAYLNFLESWDQDKEFEAIYKYLEWEKQKLAIS